MSTEIQKYDAQSMDLTTEEYDELFGGETGLEERTDEDLLMPIWCFNPTEEISPKRDVFFHSIRTDDQRDSLTVVPIYLKKTRAFTKYDGTETLSYCFSSDNVEGMPRRSFNYGAELAVVDQPIACSDCNKKNWLNDPDEPGKRLKPECSVVWNIMGVAIPDNEPCMIRFKRTSLPPIKSYLNAYYFRKGMNGGDLPLFIREMELSLDLITDGAAPYAVPKIERGELIRDKDRLYSYKAMLASFSGLETKHVEQVDPVSGNEDVGFNPEDYE